MEAEAGCEFGPAWMDEIVVAEGHTADAFSEANNLDLGITRYEAFWDVEDTRYMLFLTRIASSVYQLSLGFGPLSALQ